MKELYKNHDPEEYARIKKVIFSASVILDAIKMSHWVTEEEIAKYLTKVNSGEYKNVSFKDTHEAYVVSLWSKAKSALLLRKVVGRTPLKKKIKPPVKDVVKEFEDDLRFDGDNMKYPED